MRLSLGRGWGEVEGEKALATAFLSVSRGTLKLALAWMTPRSAPGVLPEEHAPCSWH